MSFLQLRMQVSHVGYDSIASYTPTPHSCLDPRLSYRVMASRDSVGLLLLSRVVWG